MSDDYSPVDPSKIQKSTGADNLNTDDVLLTPDQQDEKYKKIEAMLGPTMRDSHARHPIGKQWTRKSTR